MRPKEGKEALPEAYIDKAWLHLLRDHKYSALSILQTFEITVHLEERHKTGGGMTKMNYLNIAV